MSNISEIEIFTGINDVPVEATATEGCNGSALVNRVNKLISKSNYKTEAWGDCTVNVEWFVDTVDGLDTNDGLTEQTAFLTLQKALDTVAPRLIDDCYQTYIRIRGTVTGILDFSNIASWYNSWYWAGALILAKWESETLPWIYQSPDWIDVNDYTYKGSWICTKDNGLVVNTEDCIIEVGALFTITNFSLYANTTVFKSVSDFYQARILITGGTETNLGDATFDTTLQAIEVLVDNSILRIPTEFTWIKVNSLSFSLFDNSNIALSFNRLHDLYATENVTIQSDHTSSISTEQEDSYKLEGLDLSNFKGDIRFGRTNNNFSLSINLGSPGNGRYVVGIPNKPCYLKNVVVSASAGNGTLQVYLGSNPVGSPQTITFTSVDTVTWFEDINERIPYARANSVVIEITSSTGLANLFIQANLTQGI